MYESQQETREKIKDKEKMRDEAANQRAEHPKQF
jgi:hypothetical protein